MKKHQKEYLMKRIVFYVLFLTGSIMFMAASILPFFTFGKVATVIMMFSGWGIGISMIIAVLQFDRVYIPAFIAENTWERMKAHREWQKRHWRGGYGSLFDFGEKYK